MNCRPLPLWLIAALAGWFGMAWLREYLTVNQPAQASGVITAIAGSGPGLRDQARRSDAGSSAFSQLAARLSALPEAGLKAEREEVKNWLPGAAQTFALALLDARQDPNGIEPADDPFDPFRGDAEPAYNCYRTMEERMQRNVQPPSSALTDWAALDPAAASAAVLSIPDQETRALAANAIAAVMVKNDAINAMDLLSRAGGRFFLTNAAKVWLAAVKQEHFADSRAMAPLTPVQQESMAAALTSLVEAAAFDAPFDAPGSPMELSAAELQDLAKKALGRLAPGPARSRLVEAIAKRDLSALDISAIGIDLKPELPIVLAASLEQRIQQNPNAADGLVWDNTLLASLNIAAPRMLPQMARNGNLAGAVRLLDRVSGTGVRRETLEAILPAWMDADPRAARAAFEAAPLTGLEREKLERHPAFLLNQAAGK